MFYLPDIQRMDSVPAEFNFCLLWLNIYNPEQAG